MALENITKPLLVWYAQNKRDLPWRKDPSPYSIWVCEIMAQQTRIAQLMPFYLRFMERFPTVTALASATVDEVLAIWAGMGYYARARNLHTAAGVIMQEYGGNFPQTTSAWRKLPGVGAYTAGAVMSIAFGQRAAAVDGNVLRVFTRLTEDYGDIRTEAVKQKAAAQIEAAMPDTPQEISHFSQALMELGALVCQPAKPQCDICPLAAHCRAHQLGREYRLPIKTPKKPPVPSNMTVLIVMNNQGLALMRKRTEKLLNGMWVFDLCEGHLTPIEIHERIAAWGFSIERLEEIGSATHIFTHRVWHMNGYAIWVNDGTAPAGWEFISSPDAQTRALPAALKYYIKWFTNPCAYNEQK